MHHPNTSSEGGSFLVDSGAAPPDRRAAAATPARHTHKSTMRASPEKRWSPLVVHKPESCAPKVCRAARVRAPVLLTAVDQGVGVPARRHVQH